MSKNLKIDVLVEDIANAQPADYDFLTKTEFNQELESIARLDTSNKIPVVLIPQSILDLINSNSNGLQNLSLVVSQNNNSINNKLTTELAKKATINTTTQKILNIHLPDISQYPGITQYVQTNIFDVYDSKIDELNDKFDNGQFSGLDSKADLGTNGKILNSQLPNILNYPGFTNEFNPIKLKLTEDVSNLTNIVEENELVLDSLNLKTIEVMTSDSTGFIIFPGGQSVPTIKRLIDPIKANLNSEINRAKAAETTIQQSVTSLRLYTDNALSGFQSGSSKFYSTLAAANANIANIMPKTQTDTATDLINIGEVDNGGVWYKASYNANSLTKSPYDPKNQILKYIKENIVSKNLLHLSDFYTSFFVNVVENKLNNSGNFSNVLTAIIPVEPNKIYSIENFNVLNTNAFSIHESPSKSTAVNFAVSKANYFLSKDGTGSVKTSNNTNYLYVNITFLEYSNKDFKLISENNLTVFDSEVLTSLNLKTEKVVGIGKNIATDFEFGIGKVVNLNADNIFTFTPFTIASLEVESGKKYRFYCDNYLSTAFVIAFRSNNSTDVGEVFFRKTVDQIDFNSDGSFDFTVPDGMTHFLFNVHYSGDGEPFDILNSVSINEYLSDAENVSSVFGMPLVDSYSRQLFKLSVKEVDLHTTIQEGLSNNLIDIGNITVGKVILIDSDSIIDFNTYSLLSTQVEAGKKYRFYADTYIQNGFVYAFRPDSSVDDGIVYGRKTTNDLVLNSDGSFDFIVPEGMNHFLFNIRYTGSGNPFDITNSATLQEYGADIEHITEIKNIPIADLQAREKIKEIENGVGNLSPLYGKRWLAIGDSITDYSFRPYPTYKNFTQQLAEKYNMTVYNYGQSGTGFYGRYNALDQVTQSESDIDFVTVFLGTNDWGNIQVVPNNKPLGVFGDSGTNTVSGCINTLFNALLNKFPSIPVYILCPLPRSDNWGINATINQQGYTLFELVNLLKMYAQQCNFAVLDMYSESNFRCQTTAMKNIWTVNGDGVHPTLEAHQNLLPLIENFFIRSGK